MTFGDLYFYIRRQMPKILSEEQAANTLAITPENYDLVFVDVSEGRAKPLETCTLGQKIKDASWICPALMLRVRDTAIRTVLRAQSEKNLLTASSSGGGFGATSPSSTANNMTELLNSSGTFRNSVSFAGDQGSRSTQRGARSGAGRSVEFDPSMNDAIEAKQAQNTLQRVQSTYMWSDNVERGAASSIAAASGSLPTTPSPSVQGQRQSTSSPVASDAAEWRSNSIDMDAPRASSRQESRQRSVVGEHIPEVVSDDGGSQRGRSPNPSELLSALTAQRRRSSGDMGELAGPLLASPSSDASPATKSPMRSAWKKLSNVVKAASPVQLKEFGLTINDAEAEASPLLRRKSSLTARLLDMPSGTLPSATPQYAHDATAISYRDRLMALLALYDPKALRKIDRILAKSQGKEEQLLQLAVLKYGPEPKYSNVARDGAFALLQQQQANLSGTWSDPAVTGVGIQRGSIGEETLRRATMTHANSVITIDDDGIVSYKSQYRELVEFLFEEYDYLTPTAVSLFLQRVQGLAPKALGANLALHMQLYKDLRLNIERADQLRRREVERQLFIEHHASHQDTRARMWFHIYCSMERRRFEGAHLILRTSIPPQYFLGWLYLQRQEAYAWETELRFDLERKQLVWFHAFQRLFFTDKETVQRRTVLVSQRAESHHFQRFCYCDRESVRRQAREAEEFRNRCILEQWRDIERERHARIVHSTEVLEALDRRCEEFAYTSTAFNVPLRAQKFFEGCFREVYELNEVEGRMRVVQYVSQRRTWILLEQIYLLATEQELRHQYERVREDFMAKRTQQFLFGLEEADKRTLNIHFEIGCRWRILQRRWMHREVVVRNFSMRAWWKERAELEHQAMLSQEDATRRTLKRLERTRQFNVRMHKLQTDEEPEGRWFHIFGESATFRHYQRQYHYFLENAARRDIQWYALVKLFWILEAKRRGDIEIREQEEIVFMSSGGKGSMEAVRRQAIQSDGMRGLCSLLKDELMAREDLLRSRYHPSEKEARQRIFRRGIHEGEDNFRRGFVLAQECSERETLSRWHAYQREYLHRTYVLYYNAYLQEHAVSARGLVRCRELRDRMSDIREPLERGTVCIHERLDRDEIEVKELLAQEDARRKVLIRNEKAELRLPLYREEKKDRDHVERQELAWEEHDRRVYWKVFEWFTWERIPRLQIQYGMERRMRHQIERNFVVQLEAVLRRHIAKPEYNKGFFLLEQRKLIDKERVVRKYSVEAGINVGLNAIARKMLVSSEELYRMIVVDKWRSSNVLFEQRSLHLFNFVVRAHVKQDEYLARKSIERERLLDEEESSRRKLRNAALASLQKWWQKTNLQARQDVVAYANRLQREDDSRLAREGAQKRIEERLAARVAEKLKASAEAKKNQLMGLVLSDETHARSALWEEERTRMLSALHTLHEDVHATPEMLPHFVKAKQKLIKVIQGTTKIVRTNPSLEQFLSTLPPLPKGKSKKHYGAPSPSRSDDRYEEDETPFDVSLGDMSAQMEDAEHAGDTAGWDGTDVSSDPRAFTRGMSMVLPPIHSGSFSSAGNDGGSGPTASAGSPQRRHSTKQANNSETVRSELFEQSPSSRPGINDLRGSSHSSVSRAPGRSSSVTFPTSPGNISVGQVRVSLTSPSNSRSNRIVSSDEDVEDDFSLPAI